MRLAEKRHTFVITLDGLIGAQVEQLREVFVEEGMSITIHILPARSKDHRTVDFTFMFYMPFGSYLSDAQTRILEGLNLQNVVCSLYDDTGKPVGQSHEWCATHQMTLSDWLAIAGLWRKENRSKSSHHSQ